MSAEATGYVFRHSPHSGSVFAVHLAIADSVNDQHGHTFWMAVENLAGKARVSERSAQYALRTLVDAGDLEVVKEGGGKGKPTAYRFRFRETVQPLHPSETERVQNGQPKGAGSDTKGAVVAPEPKIKATQEKQPKILRSDERNEHRDEIWEALEACFGPAPKSSRYRGAWGTAAKELRDQGATPELIAERLVLYRCQMPEAACTPTALAKHWGRLGSPAARPVSKFERANARRRMRDGAGAGSEDREARRESLGLGDGRRDLRSVDGGGSGAGGPGGG